MTSMDKIVPSRIFPKKTGTIPHYSTEYTQNMRRPPFVALENYHVNM